MSQYDIWQQELYSRVNIMTDSSSEGVHFNAETADMPASNSMNVAIFQRLIWTTLFNCVQFIALLAFIWMLLIVPRVYGFVHHFHQRIRYVFHYKGPGHEDLAARIAELTDENDRRKVSLKKAKDDSAVLKEQSTRDNETILLLNTALREAKQSRRAHKNTILRLNTELCVTKSQLSELYNENTKTRIERGKAMKRVQDAEYRANVVSDYLLDLDAMGATTGRVPTAGDDLCQAMADTKVTATAEKSRTEAKDGSVLAKARVNAAAESMRLGAEDSRELADVKAKAAGEKARMEEEHSKAMNTATEKAKADTTKIGDLEVEVERLKVKIQEQSDTVLTRKKSKEEKLVGDLAHALSTLETLEAEKKETVADLDNALSSLQKLKLEKESVETARTNAMSDLSGVQSEKEKIAADLARAISDLSVVQSEKEKIIAGHRATIAEMEKYAASEKKHIDENWVRAKYYTEHLQREIQSLRNHICDHTLCRQELQSQKTETREAPQFRSEAYSELKQSNGALEKTRQELDSVKRDSDALRAVHNQCKAAIKQPAHASSDQVSGPQDEMDVGELPDKFTDCDNMDVDTPQQVLIDRLELAQQKIGELNAQNQKLLEVIKGNGDRADVLGYSPSDAAEERIREKVDRDFKEERGGYLKRIQGQAELLKKKEIKTHNISQQLQDELKAAKEKASKLEYDLSTLQKHREVKPSGSYKAPVRYEVGQTGPSSHGLSANETIQRLKFDLKRLSKESKDAKANYDRVDKLLFKRDPKACEDLRNVEIVRLELGVEIERLQKRIEHLEARLGDHRPPTSNTTAPGPTDQDGDSAGGKDGERGDEAGGEAMKELNK